MSEEIMQENNEDEIYALTPWGCLYAVMLDYNIDLSYVKSRVGEHIVEDFMDAMVNCGYISKVGDADD